MENRNISDYKDPNEILQDVPYREWTVLSMIKFSDPKGETVTHGSPYNFFMLNNLETIHLGKRVISTNW